jgi:thiol:disulfide interchange protein
VAVRHALFTHERTDAMKKLTCALLFAFCLTLVGQSVADEKKDPSKGAAFRTLTYDKALEAAKGEKKVVMIDFYADWCGPCKQMDAKTFSEEKVSNFLKEKTVAIKVNIDNNKELAKKYKITAIPCLVFIDGEGTEVGRILGFHATDKFLTEAEKHVKAK